MTLRELFVEGAKANVHELADVWLDICLVQIDDERTIRMCSEIHRAIKASTIISEGDNGDTAPSDPKEG